MLAETLAGFGVVPPVVAPVVRAVAGVVAPQLGAPDAQPLPPAP